MLYCRDCDYYRSLSPENEKEGAALCTFTDVFFAKPAERLDIEYPCRNVSFAEFEARRRSARSLSRLANDDWRLIYGREHLRPRKLRKA